jgi:Tfp pilus assembly protein PilF
MLGNYALLLKRWGRVADAEDHFRRAIEADPRHANNLGNYAGLLKKQVTSVKSACKERV